MPGRSAQELARLIVRRIATKRRPYAVFARGDAVEYAPADGPLFGSQQRNPERMALCVGVFDGSATAAQVEADLRAAGVPG